VHGSIVEYFEYFYQMSSKSTPITWSCTVVKLSCFLSHSVYIYDVYKRL